MALRSVRFDSGDLSLEGRLAEPEGASAGGVVLCHPHPLYGGSMSSALLPALQRALVAAGLVTLRFNFRGAGRSDGTYDRGIGETDDALAALAFVRSLVPPEVPTSIAGWSFGAVVALRAAVRDPHVSTATGIALPVKRRMNMAPETLPDPAELVRRPGRLLLVAGEQDEVAPPGDVIMYGRDARAHVDVVRGANHFFTDHFDDVAHVILEFLAPEPVE